MSAVAMVETMMGSDWAPTLDDSAEVQAEAQQDDRVLQHLLAR